MLYIATVHYRSPRWIEIQARYLREHLSVPYETWSSLELIDDSQRVHFDRVLELKGHHSDKLNHIAFEISRVASDGDLIMFLDGDAFPVADPMPLIESGLSEAPLVAVRRAENVGERQPHPCFCVTTVGTWRRLRGDWSYGYCWLDGEDRLMSDVGSNLLRRLELTDTPWTEVLRTNRKNLDPLFFAIYGDAIYHHGAGFRSTNFGRIHLEDRPRPKRASGTPLARAIVRQLNWRRQRRWERALGARQARDSELVMTTIETGDSQALIDLV